MPGSVWSESLRRRVASTLCLTLWPLLVLTSFSTRIPLSTTVPPAVPWGSPPPRAPVAPLRSQPCCGAAHEAIGMCLLVCFNPRTSHPLRLGNRRGWQTFSRWKLHESHLGLLNEEEKTFSLRFTPDPKPPVPQSLHYRVQGHKLQLSSWTENATRCH